MRVLLCLIPALLIGGSALAQEPADPRGYFPLAVGNEWEYEVRLERPASPYRPTDESRTEYLRVRIVAAGAGGLADRFTLVEERFAEDGAVLARDTSVVRYDAESASVLTTDVRPDGSPFDRPAPSFAADLDLQYGEQGEWSWSAAWVLDAAEAESEVPAFVRDPLAPVVAKRFFNLGGGVATAVHGFGFVADAFYPDGCSLFCDETVARVTYAVVDGQTFGARAVGVEALPERAGASPLVVYPNPASGRATVRAGSQSGSNVAVFDVAGRLVRTAALRSDGTVALDLGGLPAGVYLLRAGARTGRVVVR